MLGQLHAVIAFADSGLCLLRRRYPYALSKPQSGSAVNRIFGGFLPFLRLNIYAYPKSGEAALLVLFILLKINYIKACRDGTGRKKGEN